MLTRTFRNGTTIDIDPARAVKAARELQPPDPRELVRGLDTVPERVSESLGSAGESLRDAGETLRETIHTLSAPRRRQRRPSGRLILAGIAIGAVLVGLGTWLARRSVRRSTWSAVGPGPIDDTSAAARLDREALERATGEGMGTNPGADVAAGVPVMGRSEPFQDVDPFAVPPAPLQREDEVAVRPSAGYGQPPRT